MKVEKNKIYTFALVNGQEIVSNLEEIDDHYYHLGNPLTLGRDPNGNMGFIMPAKSGAPLGDAALLRNSVALILPTRGDVLESYEKSVDPSSIAVPDKKIIMG